MAISKVIIIGGGASGLAAAVSAAKQGAEVTILEHKDRVGKKILMTGNGKCNLTNVSDYHGKYYSSDEKSLKKIYNTFERFGANETIEFFEEIGLYTKEKRDGGVYPMSEQASCVLDVLRSECEYRKVKILTECETINIEPQKKGVKVSFVQYIYQDKVVNSKGKKKVRELIKEDKKNLVSDKVILATGGKAAAVSGSDGTGYKLAKALGHSIITPLPALVQLKCEGDYFKSVSGVRVQADLELYINNKSAAKECGELQLTDYGISGIPVFQFSRIASRAMFEKKSCKVKINFIPDMKKLPDSDKLGYKGVEEFLSGFVNKKLANLICRKHGILPNQTLKQIGLEKTKRCVNELQSFWVTVTDTNSFDNAQVCSGGVPLSEVSDNFESLKCPNVYLTGELLDCDAICGGYNLQWAWSTGIIAGRAVCE